MSRKRGELEKWMALWANRGGSEPMLLGGAYTASSGMWDRTSPADMVWGMPGVLVARCVPQAGCGQVRAHAHAHESV